MTKPLEKEKSCWCRRLSAEFLLRHSSPSAGHLCGSRNRSSAWHRWWKPYDTIQRVLISPIYVCSYRDVSVPIRSHQSRQFEDPGTPGVHLTKIAHKHSATLEPTVLLLNWFSHEQDLAKILQQDVKTCTVTICSLACNVQICVDHRPCRPCLSYLSASVVLLMFFECLCMALASGVRFGRLCYSGTWGAAQPGRAGRNVFEHAVGRSPWATLDGQRLIKIDVWNI